MHLATSSFLLLYSSNALSTSSYALVTSSNALVTSPIRFPWFTPLRLKASQVTIDVPLLTATSQPPFLAPPFGEQKASTAV